MSRLVPDHCQFKGTRGANRGRGGPVEECLKPAKYLCPDGEVRTLLLYSAYTNRYLGPCHWDRYKTLKEQAVANWPDFPTGYVLWEEVEAARALEESQRQFAWALTVTVEAHPGQGRGGLRRMDGSGYIEEFQPRVRRIE